MKNQIIKKEIELLRNEYNKFLANHTDLLSLEEFYINHLFGSDKFFGEYFIYWLSELFEIKNIEFLRKLSFGSVLLRSYMIIQDDLIDGDIEKSPNNLLIADLFLVKSLEVLSSLVKDKELFWEKLNLNLNEYTHINKEFVQKVAKPSRYSINDFKKYIKRISLVEIPLFIILNKSGTTSSRIDIYSLIRHFYTALQFADDLCDWKKDYLSNYFTYPIATISDALKYINISGRKRVDQLSKLRVVLGLSNFVKLYLELIEFHLLKSIELIKSNKQSYLFRFLTGVLNGFYSEQKKINNFLNKNNQNDYHEKIFIINKYKDYKIVKLNSDLCKKKCITINLNIMQEKYLKDTDDMFSMLSPPLLQKIGINYTLGGYKNGRK